MRPNPRNDLNDVQFAKLQDNWPCWPYLPVKRRDSNMDNKNLGVLWIGTKGLVVHHVYLYGLPKTLEEFKAMPKTEYNSIEELFADGWVID